MARTEVWRALYGAAMLRADCGKYVIALNEDIDADNADAVFWSFAYRANPAHDVQILPHRHRGHGPKNDYGGNEDATLKGDMPPLALPKKKYMENAKDMWKRFGLPELKPQAPWHGYSLGDWDDEWDEMAQRAVDGDYMENGRRSAQRRRRGLTPNISLREAPPEDG